MPLTFLETSEPFGSLGIDMAARPAKAADAGFAPEKQTHFEMINDTLYEQSRNFTGLARRDAAARTAVLGRRLREMYREVANEPIPSEFARLLEKLDAGEKN